MPILLLGSDNLLEPLRQLGQQVIYCGPDAQADIPLADPDPEWAVLEKKLAGVKPSLVLVSDNIGARSLPTGLWGASAPTVFYGVDAPLNDFWQPTYSQLFDIACLDQKAQVVALAARHPRCFWLPVGINEKFYHGIPAAQPKAGVCFVGVVHDALRPKRSAILKKVQQISALEIQGGRQQNWFSTSQAVELYQNYQVTLNENLFPGVTTRPLEVMAAGGCLFTEDAPGHMDEFFHHQEHLYYYHPQDILPGLRQLLSDVPLQQRLRKHGREAVLSAHTLQQRAARLLEWVNAYPERRTPDSLTALAWEAETLLMAGLRWPGSVGSRRLLRARGRLRSAAAVCAGNNTPALLALAEAVMGHWHQAIASQYKALALASDTSERMVQLINLGLCMHYNLQGGKARSLWRRHLRIKSQPGQVGFHLAAAEILCAAGKELSPGFSRHALWPGAWYALEHLLHALSLSKGPERGQVFFILGQLLLRNQVPNQAYDCFCQAADAGFKHAQLAELTVQAGTQGYLL